MRKLPLAILIPSLLSGCASTEYVDSKVSASDDRVATLTRELEQLRQSQSLAMTEQYQRYNGLNQGLSDQAGNLGRLTGRMTEAERGLASHGERLSGLETSLARQAGQLRMSESLGRQALEMASRADTSVGELGRRVDDLALGQSGLRAGMDKLATRQQESDAGLAQALHQTTQAEARGTQAAERADAALSEAQALNGRLRELSTALDATRAQPASPPAQAAPAATAAEAAALSDPEARRLAREALGLANAAMEKQAALLARLEALSNPPAAAQGADVARATQADAGADTALVQSGQALEQVRALAARVDALLQPPAATPPQAAGMTLPAEIDQRLSQGEQRIQTIAADVSQHGQRLVGVEGGVEQASAATRQALERVAGLDESGRQLDVRLKHSETLLLGMRDQLAQHQNRLQSQEDQLGQISVMAREALERAMAAGRLAQGKFVHEVTLSEDKFHFGFESAELTPESIAALDDLVLRLNALNADVYLEIQGHTDNRGPAETNLDLAQRRAMAVRDYLNLRGHVPLHRLGVIAIGEARPVADNATREGRKQNRRVVIEVLR